MPDSVGPDAPGLVPDSAASEPMLVYTSAPTERCEWCNKMASYVVTKSEGEGRIVVCSEHLAHAVGSVLYAR